MTIKAWSRWTAAITLATTLSLHPVGAAARGPGGDFSQLAEKLSASVVNIASSRESAQNPFGAPPGGGGVRSLGSGFIIDPSGLIVTNNHVVRNATGIMVYLIDDTVLPAQIVGRDSETDIAVLKVEAGRRLPAVTFGNSDDAKVGSWALAIGNPFGFGGTVTLGIISARDRKIKDRSPASRAGARPQYFDFFIQTDAAINSGNSGGPLFNTTGEVIGINTAIISPTNSNVGLAFAIPSSFAKVVVDQIKQFGEARLGFLGVSVQPVDDVVAERFGLAAPRGVRITQIRPDSPAQVGGLLPNDIILSYGDSPVNKMRRLPRLVARTPVGSVVPIQVWRQGREITVEVTIQPLPKGTGQRLSIAPPEPRRFAGLGVTLSELSLPMRIQHGIHRDTDGLFVVSVDANSPLANRVRPGDLISDVFGTPVSSMADMESEVDRAVTDQTGALLVKIDRKDETVFEALEIKP